VADAGGDGAAVDEGDDGGGMVVTAMLVGNMLKTSLKIFPVIPSSPWAFLPSMSSMICLISSFVKSLVRCSWGLFCLGSDEFMVVVVLVFVLCWGEVF
jgi:hypothetical protein